MSGRTTLSFKLYGDAITEIAAIADALSGMKHVRKLAVTGGSHNSRESVLKLADALRYGDHRIRVVMLAFRPFRCAEQFVDAYEANPWLEVMSLSATTSTTEKRLHKIRNDKFARRLVFSLFTPGPGGPITKFLRRDGDNAIMNRVLQFLLARR